MAGVLRSWAIPRRVLLWCGLATLVLSIPLVGAYLLAGIPPAISVVMGYVVGSRPATSLPPARAFALTIPAAMAGAVAVALRGQPLPAAFFVALCCLLVAPAGMLSDGLMAGVPYTAAVLVAVPGDFEPGPVALWILLGSALMVLLGRRVGAGNVRAEGIAPARAWRHAIVMAVAVATAVYLALFLGWPHAYWLAVSITVVLRPFDDQTVARSRERVIGTLGGALLSVVLAGLLPPWGLVVAVCACQVLNLAYTVLGDYSRQVLFLTPTVVLLGSATASALAAERLLYTLGGAVLAGLIALALARYDRASQQADPA